ncbi:hypothetical protein [Actinomadura madurae]|uniref:hypothetical protein n=1 Tax=Actinomadura madurae TaxID=1993 RepID=UPI0020D23552|nr:hypothetical protein [Actinomadura madurae]MCQ0020425.1 hypothetical protein [Actinomadura madurae]
MARVAGRDHARRRGRRAGPVRRHPRRPARRRHHRGARHRPASGEEPIRTDAAGWARVLADLASETGFDSFVYWPEDSGESQIRQWGREVVPAAQALLSAQAGRTE